jgi:hypothetical protein
MHLSGIGVIPGYCGGWRGWLWSRGGDRRMVSRVASGRGGVLGPFAKRERLGTVKGPESLVCLKTNAGDSSCGWRLSLVDQHVHRLADRPQIVEQ